MASVRWTVGAREDLRAIVEYVSQDSTMYAAALAGRIVAAVERLRRHPKLGRVVPTSGNELRQRRQLEKTKGTKSLVVPASGSEMGGSDGTNSFGDGSWKPCQS